MIQKAETTPQNKQAIKALLAGKSLQKIGKERTQKERPNQKKRKASVEGKAQTDVGDLALLLQIDLLLGNKEGFYRRLKASIG